MVSIDSIFMRVYSVYKVSIDSIFMRSHTETIPQHPPCSRLTRQVVNFCISTTQSCCWEYHPNPSSPESYTPSWHRHGKLCTTEARACNNDNNVYSPAQKHCNRQPLATDGSICSAASHRQFNMFNKETA